MTSTVLVSTPTGRIGTHLVQQLLVAPRDQLRLRLFAHALDRVPPEVRAASEVVVGDLRSKADLTRALDGVDAFFLCVPQDAHALDVAAHYRGAGEVAISAMRAAHVDRVVFVSSGGRGRAEGAGFICELHRLEDALAATIPHARFLRCGAHLETLLDQLPSLRATGSFASPLASSLALPRVAVRDLAGVASALLLDRSWSGTDGVPVHGAEHLSAEQVARQLSVVLERVITYRQVPLEAFEQGLVTRGHVSPAFARALVAMFRAIGQGMYDAEPRTAASTTPTTFSTWAREVLAPQL